MYSFISAAAWEILATVCSWEGTLSQAGTKKKSTQPDPDAPHTEGVIIHSIFQQEKPLKDHDPYFVTSLSKIN